MSNPFLIIDQNPSEAGDLCRKMEEFDFTGISLDTLHDLDRHLENQDRAVLLIDLDSGLADNREFRKIKRRFPGTTIMGLSSRQFHPDLKEAIGTLIYAVIRKPVDPEELAFLLRSVKRGGEDSRVPG